MPVLLLRFVAVLLAPSYPFRHLSRVLSVIRTVILLPGRVSVRCFDFEKPNQGVYTNTTHLQCLGVFPESLAWCDAGPDALSRSRPTLARLAQSGPAPDSVGILLRT